MKNQINYIIIVIALLIGLGTTMLGTKLIIQTYQHESMLTEELKTGFFPKGEHANWIKERGIKDGAFHIAFLSFGVSILILSLILITKNLQKK